MSFYLIFRAHFDIFMFLLVNGCRCAVYGKLIINLRCALIVSREKVIS